jgi:hypothetical protein
LRVAGLVHKLLTWALVSDTVSGLVQMSSRLRRPESELPSGTAGGGPLGQLEARLAGVVVAALKEAFDRDRARMDLERAHMDAERQRAEEALRAELRRQAAERALSQLRMIAVMAFGLLMVSAALGVFLPGARLALPRTLLGGGWVLAIAALGCAFAAWRHGSAWSCVARQVDLSAGTSGAELELRTASAAPWLLLAALVMTLASLLFAL